MKDNRLFRVLYYILRKGKVTAKELSVEFEVSIRTIYRYIEVLSSAGVPIYTIQGKGGGIEIAEEYVLDKSLFTQDEKEQLISALQGLNSTSDISKNELLTKLSALFKMRSINWIEIDFNNWQNSREREEKFNQLKYAILAKNVISFSYFGINEKETIRNVKPARLLFKGQDWYLFAFCLLRNDFRYFKLSRIKSLKTLQLKFEDNFENITLKKEIKYENLIRVKVKFEHKVAFRVYDELGTGIIEDSEGNLYTEIEMPNDYSLYSYILSFGDTVEVLEPNYVRLQIKEIIKKMEKKYII